jgi:D-alanyl-D-alanine carboxypeptidase/D-alanyl-D-alanine-endopeptidase (penicillin-binding protein 4)
MGQKTQHQGSWAAGLDTELGKLKNVFGVQTDDLLFVDGSGLSNVNFTTPQLTTDLLLAAQRQSWFATWYDALPIAGQANPLVGGTLASRMRDTRATGNVHAKTGSLDNVSALSGYVTDADGKRLVFSVMFNNFIHGSAKPFEDAIATRLANYSRNEQPAAAAARKPELRQAPVNQDPSVECSWTRQGC